MGVPMYLLCVLGVPMYLLCVLGVPMYLLCVLVVPMYLLCARCTCSTYLLMFVFTCLVGLLCAAMYKED